MALVKYNNNSISAITDVDSSMKGAMTLIKEQTASSSSTINFVDGTSDVVLDNTYPIYLFKFINIHPETNNAEFVFNVSIDSGSNYNVAKTTTWVQCFQNEAGNSTGVEYVTAHDLAQGTGTQIINYNMGTDNDENLSGELWLFNPSSTTYAKHFMARTNNTEASGYSIDSLMAGYANTTSALDAIQFSASTGDIDAGTIKLYGIKDS